MNDTFELHITWRTIIGFFLAGSSLIFMSLSILYWFLAPFLENPNLENGLFSLSYLAISIATGSLFFLGFIFYFSFGLLVQSIKYINLMNECQGILYKLEPDGFSYLEDGQLLKRPWSDISDVGLFKQDSEKNKLIYYYQIIFTDGTRHTFDLRGTYPTKEFKLKIEEFWMEYIYEG